MSSKVSGPKSEFITNIIHIPNDYIDTEKEENYNFNYFITQYDISKYQKYQYITSTHNTKFTAFLYEIKEDNMLLIVILRNIFDLDGENIDYKQYRTIKLNKSYVEIATNEDKILNNIDIQDKKNKKKKKVIHLVCDTFLLLEVDKKKIILIDFEEKKYTTLFTSSSAKKSIHIVYTYDELLNIHKTANEIPQAQTQYLTRTYVFCVSEGQLYFFLLNNQALYHLQFILYSFPFEELKVNIEQILIQKCQQEQQSEWYFLIVVLQEGKMTRYITDYTSNSFKNFLLEFRDMTNKGIIKKICTPIDKATFAQVKFVIFENQQSFIMLHIDKVIYMVPFMVNYSPAEMKEKFQFENYENSLSSSLLIASNLNSPTLIRRSTDELNFNYDRDAKDKLNIFNTEKDVLTYRLPLTADYQKAVINVTSKNLCCFINNHIYIYNHYQAWEGDIKDNQRNIFQHVFKGNIILYDFIQYSQLNYCMILTNESIIKLRYNNNINTLLTKLIRQRRSIAGESDSVNVCLKNIFSHILCRDSSVTKCKSCLLLKDSIKCPNCKIVGYCSMRHLNKDFRDYHFFECELIQCMTFIENMENRPSQTVINNFIISINKTLDHIVRFIRKSIDYHFYIIYLQLILRIIKLSKIEMFIITMLEMKTDKNNHLKICDKIFNLELVFVYDSIQILLINFAIQANLFFLANQLFNSSKFIFILYRKQDNKMSSLLNSFGFSNDFLKVNISQNEKSVLSYGKSLFFSIEKYIKNKNICIYDYFFRYYLYSNASILKIALYLHSIPKEEYFPNDLIVQQVTIFLTNIATLVEDKYNNNFDIADIKQKKYSKFMVPFVYFNLVFPVIRIGKLQTSIRILKEIVNIVQDNKNYYHFKGIIYYNLGLLMTFVGNYDMGIHYFEESYRIAFGNVTSSKYTMKIYYTLSIAYINVNKPETAYCLIREALQLAKRVNYSQHSFKKFLKLKIYLIYLLDLIGFQYNSLQIDEKKNNKHSISKNQNKFNGISEELLGYILDEKSEKTLKDISGKYNIMFLRVLEFFYQLSSDHLIQLNDDNRIMKTDTFGKEDIPDRSIFVERDTSLNVSTNHMIVNKDINSIKDDEEVFNFEDEIEIKLDVYDELEPNQKIALSNLDNKLFLRSNILRDPKGVIDKFNLNFHPIYTYDYFVLLNKLSENYILKKINKYAIINNSDGRFFNYKPGDYLTGLSNFCNMDRIRTIMQIENDKRKESIKNLETPKKQEVISHECHEWINAINNSLLDKQINMGYLDNAFREIFYLLTEQERDYIQNYPEQVFNYIYTDIHHKVILPGNESKDSIDEGTTKMFNDEYDKRKSSFFMTSFDLGKPKRASSYFIKKNNNEKGKLISNSIRGTIIFDENSLMFSGSDENPQNEKDDYNRNMSIFQNRNSSTSNLVIQPSSKRLPNTEEEPIKEKKDKETETESNEKKKGKSIKCIKNMKSLEEEIRHTTKEFKVKDKNTVPNSEIVDYSQIIYGENNSPFMSENFSEESSNAINTQKNEIKRTKTYNSKDGSKRFESKEDRKLSIETKKTEGKQQKNKTDTEFLEEIIQNQLIKKKQIRPLVDLSKINNPIRGNSQFYSKSKPKYRNKSQSTSQVSSNKVITLDEPHAIISALLRKDKDPTFRELIQQEDQRKKRKEIENKRSSKQSENIYIINQSKPMTREKTKTFKTTNPISPNKTNHVVQFRKPPTYQQMKERVLKKSSSQVNF